MKAASQEIIGIVFVCEKHAEKQRLYCLECEELICPLCHSVVGHKSHSVLFAATEVGGKNKLTLKNYIASAEKRIGDSRQKEKLSQQLIDLKQFKLLTEDLLQHGILEEQICLKKNVVQRIAAITAAPLPAPLPSAVFTLIHRPSRKDGVVITAGCFGVRNQPS